MTTIYTDHQERFEAMRKIIPSLTLHCYKCGYVLLNLRPEELGTTWDRCTNSSCRKTNRFIETKGKIKLFTNKLLNQMTDEELQPYTKDDMLELVIK